jgi:hypothetical protein
MKSRRMRWAGHVACIGERRVVYRDLVGKSEGKRPLEGPRPRWANNIKMVLNELGCEVIEWIELDQDRDTWRALAKRCNEPPGSIKCGEFLDWLQTS